MNSTAAIFKGAFGKRAPGNGGLSDLADVFSQNVPIILDTFN